MAGWTTHTGVMLHLPLENVDTDQLIPARFMSVPRSEGYGDYLMHDLRRDGSGALLTDFPLNIGKGSILIAGRNFGTGSSREAAVYALVDAGFAAVIAPSFGDIFASNAVNNGLLPAQVPAQTIAKISGAETALINLETRVIQIGSNTLPFDLDDTWQQKLINGWDDIDLTLHHGDAITRYRESRAKVAGAWPRQQP